MKKYNNHQSPKEQDSDSLSKNVENPSISNESESSRRHNMPNNHVINEIVNFLDCTSGFTYKVGGTNLKISQKEDSKTIVLPLTKIDKVLVRQDFDGSVFLQVNFHGGSKVLITKILIGFKPTALVGFDSQKIPKVVTTVDLKSVVAAIEETYEDDGYQTEVELEILTKVYHSILLGAEAVGFEMIEERNWFVRSMLNRKAATA